MGLTETILEHASVSSVLLGIFGLWCARFFLTWLVEEFRIRRRGGHGQRMKTWLPFGLDFVWRDAMAAKAFTAYDLWLDLLPRAPGGRYTAEARLLGRRLVFTADPDNIKALLATQFADYGKGAIFHRAWHPFLGDSIFTTDGDRWHASRQLLRPQFVRDRVSDLHTFERHARVLFRAMANGGALDGAAQPVGGFAAEGMDGRTLEISDLFYRFTLDSSTDFLLGHTVSSLCNPKEEFAEAFNEVQRVQTMISRVGPLRPFMDLRSYRAGIKTIDRFINNFVERALLLTPDELAKKASASASATTTSGADSQQQQQQQQPEPYTFLHELASFTRDPAVLRDQLVAVLLAGRDTTAGTLSWALYELGRRPDAVSRLRAEIRDVVGPLGAGGQQDRCPTYADLKDMKFLQAILNETLRLYPAVPFNVRFSLRDTTLPRGGGPDGTDPLPVLKDTPVGYSTLVMQRRPDLYPASWGEDPDLAVDRFAPERWVGTGWQPRPWQHVPFNGGPRICIGQQFALTLMGYLLVRMFQRFERVETRNEDGGRPRLKSDITLSPGDGVYVAFWEAKREE